MCPCPVPWSSVCWKVSGELNNENNILHDSVVIFSLKFYGDLWEVRLHRKDLQGRLEMLSMSVLQERRKFGVWMALMKLLASHRASNLRLWMWTNLSNGVTTLSLWVYCSYNRGPFSLFSFPFEGSSSNRQV